MTKTSPSGFSYPSKCTIGRNGHTGLVITRWPVVAILLYLFAVQVATGQQPSQRDDPNATPRYLIDQYPQTLEQVQHLEQTVKELAERLKACTVSVGGGSGVIVSEDGLILTCAHVGGSAGRTVNVRLADGRRVTAETLGNHHQTDAGMMKIKTGGPWPYAPVADRADVRQGLWCLAMGYPVSFTAGREAPVRLGRILRTTDSSITTDATIMGGDSGGPLFDLQGRVIGINSRVGNSLTGNVHVHIGAFHTHWQDLIAGKDYQTGARLGVNSDPQSRQAKVQSVVPDSAAEKAGILAGDEIIEFNRQPVETFEQLRSLVSQCRPGQRVRVKIKRGEEILDLRAELGGQ
ncbi:MAG TPA: trypsin-like peptidase domain-containing protein [Pirellulaceae bacterium]|nr:trypsin-like peptidase domain-containing protein [Pirellulaceae bacterium]